MLWCASREADAFVHEKLAERPVLCNIVDGLVHSWHGYSSSGVCVRMAVLFNDLDWVAMERGMRLAVGAAVCP